MQNDGAMSSSPTAFSPKSRLPWVEIARLLATLSVILQHTPDSGAPFNGCLIGPALALFFTLAGYYSAAKQLGDGGVTWLAGRLKFLALPYVFWCGLYWLMAGMPCEGWATVRSVFGLGMAPMLTPMWFLRDLMVFTALAFLLARCSKTLFFTLGLFCLFLNNWDTGLAWPGPDSFGYYALGVMIGGWRAGFLESYGRLPLAVHGGILCAAATFVWARMNAGAYLNLSGAFAPLMMAGLLSFGIVLKGAWPAAAHKAVKLAEGSFFIYCSHIFVMCIISGYVLYSERPLQNWVWWCLVPVIYLVCRCVFQLLKRFAPRALTLCGK